MVDIHPHFITDSSGKKLVILSQAEFDTILEELEDLEDVKLYDKAKKEDDGARISLDDYLKLREANNGWIHHYFVQKGFKAIGQLL